MARIHAPSTSRATFRGVKGSVMLLLLRFLTRHRTAVGAVRHPLAHRPAAIGALLAHGYLLPFMDPGRWNAPSGGAFVPQPAVMAT